MLASFAAEVDEGLAALLDDVEPAGRAADRGLVAVPDVLAGRRRGHGLRATTIAVVLGATLSVSGVAAAVTGDPLSPYKGIVSAVHGGGNDHQHDNLPSHAARVATMNHKLAGTRAQIAHGDLAGAEATLAGLRLDLASMTDLTTGERSAIEARIAALEAAIGRANGQTAAHDQQPKSGTKASHTAAPNNTKAQQPSSTKSPRRRTPRRPSRPRPRRPSRTTRRRRRRRTPALRDPGAPTRPSPRTPRPPSPPTPRRRRGEAAASRPRPTRRRRRRRTSGKTAQGKAATR